MATLRRRESDGGYYVRVGFGALGITTYQVNAQALKVLRRHGISEGDPIPRPLIEQLRDARLLTTGGSGMTAGDAIGELIRSAPGPKLALVFDIPERQWALAVRLQEISPDLLNDLPDPAAQLARCGIAVGERKVSALKLWPGAGGQRLVVEPSESSYRVRSYGEWPADWNLARWTGECAAISESGDVFDEDGERLSPGTPVNLGHDHFYLARGDCVGIGFPQSIEVEELGEIDGWFAYRLGFPERLDIPLQHWLTKVGHAVSEEEYRLTLVSAPPQAFASDSIPVLEVGGTALIRLQFVGKGHASLAADFVVERDGQVLRVQRISSSEMERGLLEMPLYESGSYRMWAANHPSNIVAFRAAPVASVVDWKRPRAVAICVTLGKGRLMTFEGLTEQLAVLEVRPQDEPKIEVLPSPVSLSMLVVRRNETRRLDVTSGVQFAEAAIRSVALTMQSAATIRVDGGAYGHIEVRVQPAPDPRAVLKESMPIRLLSWFDRLVTDERIEGAGVNLTATELETLKDPRLRLANLPLPRPIPAWIAARVRRMLPLLAKPADAAGYERS